MSFKWYKASKQLQSIEYCNSVDDLLKNLLYSKRALEKHYLYERYCENCSHYKFTGFFETPRGTRKLYEKDCKNEAECLLKNHCHWQDGRN